MSRSFAQLPLTQPALARRVTASAAPVRCHTAPDSWPESSSTSQLSTRRSTLLAVGAAALWPTTRPAAADVAAPQLEAPPSQATTGAKQYRTFNEKDFVLEVPRSFKDTRSEDSSGGFGSGGRPLSTYERIAASSSPLRVKFTSQDEKELLTVIQRNASEVKQSFTQITDVSQLGDLAAVAALLLPREVVVEAQGSAVIDQEDRETKSFLGTIKVPPQTVYRYTFRTRGQHAHLSVVAKAGKLYLTAGSASDAVWKQASARLKASVVSFRLV